MKQRIYTKYKLIKSFIVVMQEYFGNEWKENIPNVIGKSRKTEHVLPRHIIWNIWVKHYGYYTRRTGFYFSDRDHSSVIHGANKVDDYCSVDAEYRTTYNKVLKKLGIDTWQFEILEIKNSIK